MEYQMKYTIASLVLISVLAGCVPTTGSTLKYAQSNYHGKNMDMLVMDIGAPKSKYVMQSGDILYKWVYSGTLNMPSTTIYNSSATAYGYGNTVNAYGSGTATTFGGGVSNRICDISVLTSRKNIIKRIKINQDTMGTQALTASMCAQMFGIN